MGQECGAVRKISKIYRALASGIVEEDEARPLYYFAMIHLFQMMQLR